MEINETKKIKIKYIIYNNNYIMYMYMRVLPSL